jgi:hypothetical protein
VNTAIEDAIKAAILQKNHLITSAVLRSSRDSILNSLPRREDIVNNSVLNVRVEISEIRRKEEDRFEVLAAAADWDGLLARYPLRESSAFDRIVSGIKIADRGTYRASVLKLLHDDASAIEDLRNLLGGLYADIS